MPTKLIPTAPPPEKLPIARFSEQAYLNYSMYVILDRALPSLADGLKPVQRRIVYAMSDLGLHAAAKHKKSARTVGDVLGKFHPHGDAACYEAMVLMAQPFSYRYPLIDGQGNWGSQDDPKSFAAMRYTESRLTPYAQLLLAEIGRGTVDWADNFDGTLQEPKLLPARLPNVLLNGATGIAVGMATDIPPHNMREVVTACVRLLEAPDSDVEALCEHIRGPDFPTAAEIITPPEELLNMYRSGSGAVRQRAVWRKEGGAAIVLNALPYQVSGARVQEQIAAQMVAKKLPMVADLRDESDHEHAVRLVIELRSNRVDADALMLHLFATTDLERSYRVNLNMIGLDGRPRVFDLKTLLSEWLTYRKATVTRRLRHRLEQVMQRLHILDGLLAAYLNLDEVIAIIRAEDAPRPVLMARFQLSEIQAEAILELKLRHLARLEEMKIRGEQEQLTAERKGLEKILASKRGLITMVRDEMLADAEKYGDPRRAPLASAAAAQAMDPQRMVPAEPITVVLSAKGWIRAAKGHEVEGDTLGYRAGDHFLDAVRGKTRDLLIALDSTGRCYAIPPHTLPSARGFGEPLSSSLQLPPEAVFRGLMMGAPQTDYLLCTDAGYGFIAPLNALHAQTKGGKGVMRVAAGSSILVPHRVRDYEAEQVAVITNVGRMLIFPVAELPRRGAGKGVKLIGIPTARYAAGEECVVCVVTFGDHERLRLTSGKRHLTLRSADLGHYAGQRSQRGHFLPRGFRQVQAAAVAE